MSVTLHLDLPGTCRRVHVRLSGHAIERYVERVRPGLDVSRAAEELERLAPVAKVTAEAPTWRKGGWAPMYCEIGDVIFTLDVERGQQDRLVATTCVVRGMSSSRRSRARRAKQRRPQKKGAAPVKRWTRQTHVEGWEGEEAHVR